MSYTACAIAWMWSMLLCTCARTFDDISFTALRMSSVVALLFNSALDHVVDSGWAAIRKLRSLLANSVVDAIWAIRFQGWIFDLLPFRQWHRCWTCILIWNACFLTCKSCADSHETNVFKEQPMISMKNWLFLQKLGQISPVFVLTGNERNLILAVGKPSFYGFLVKKHSNCHCSNGKTKKTSNGLYIVLVTVHQTWQWIVPLCVPPMVLHVLPSNDWCIINVIPHRSKSVHMHRPKA